MPSDFEERMERAKKDQDFDSYLAQKIQESLTRNLKKKGNFSVERLIRIIKRDIDPDFIDSAR